MEPPELLQSIIDVSHVEFNLYDFSKNELICTSGLAEKILGYTPARIRELVSRKWLGIVHPEDRSRQESYIDRVIHSRPGEVLESTARLCKANGEYMWVYMRKLVAKRDEAGNPKEIITLAEDVTRLVTVEQELSVKVDQLKKISFRNSHELRAPVANIIGLLDLVDEEQIMSNQVQQIFSHLKTTVAKLDGIIREINDIAHSK